MNKRFIIDVGKYLQVTTPYSESVFDYDDLEECLKDLEYCLYTELKMKGEKHAQKENAQV